MNFEDILWLFNCNPKIAGTRNVIRMNLLEAGLLWRAVKQTRGRILEIGRNLGGSTTLLLAASESEEESREVVSIDISSEIPRNWEKQYALTQEFFKNHSGRLKLLVGNSHTLSVPGPFGMLFIDGDHTYEGVKADIQNHWNSLDIGGLAVFHDASQNDEEGCGREPEQAIRDTVLKTGQATKVETASSALSLKKIF